MLQQGASGGALGASSPLPDTADSGGGGSSLSLSALEREETTHITPQSLGRIVLPGTVAVRDADLWRIEHLLDDVCAELPFLRRSWLVDRARRPRVQDAAWGRGLLHAVSAAAIQAKRALGPSHAVSAHSWAFFRGAYAALPELLLQGGNLGAAQAVMAMAVFMRLSADSQTTAVLLSIATRMQHAIGLGIMANGRGGFSTAEEEEEEDWYRLLWATVILDVDMSAGSGLPPARADLDGITANPPRFIGSHHKDIIFGLRAELARIQARVGAHLVDPKEAALAALELELDSWALQTPFNGMLDLRDLPGSSGFSGGADDVPTLMLKLAYFNCRSMICWAFARLVATESAQAGQPIDRADDRAAGHRRAARRVSRAILRSLPQFPTRSFTSLW